MRALRRRRKINCIKWARVIMFAAPILHVISSRQALAGCAPAFLDLSAPPPPNTVFRSVISRGTCNMNYQHILHATQPKLLRSSNELRNVDHYTKKNEKKRANLKTEHERLHPSKLQYVTLIQPELKVNTVE